MAHPRRCRGSATSRRRARSAAAAARATRRGAGMRRPFPTKDGYLCFLPYNDLHWARFFERTGRADLAADPDFSTMRGRQANLGRVWDEVGREVNSRTSAEWTDLLAGTDIPNAVLNDLED